MGGCTRISIYLRPDIRCSQVGKTGICVSRLMNGKAAVIPAGLGLPKERRGLTSTRQSGMSARLHFGVRVSQSLSHR
jgi:hypothetical protein